MKTITSSELTGGSLAMLAEAGPNGVVITKRGKPVARLVPVEDGKPKTGAFLISAMKGKVGIKGNIFSTGIKWDAESGHSCHPVRAKRRAQTERGKARK